MASPWRKYDAAEKTVASNATNKNIRRSISPSVKTAVGWPVNKNRTRSVSPSVKTAAGWSIENKRPRSMSQSVKTAVGLRNDENRRRSISPSQKTALGWSASRRSDDHSQLQRDKYSKVTFKTNNSTQKVSKFVEDPTYQQLDDVDEIKRRSMSPISNTAAESRLAGKMPIPVHSGKAKSSKNLNNSRDFYKENPRTKRRLIIAAAILITIIVIGTISIIVFYAVGTANPEEKKHAVNFKQSPIWATIVTFSCKKCFTFEDSNIDKLEKLCHYTMDSKVDAKQKLKILDRLQGFTTTLGRFINSTQNHSGTIDLLTTLPSKFHVNYQEVERHFLQKPVCNSLNHHVMPGEEEFMTWSSEYKKLLGSFRGSSHWENMTVSLKRFLKNKTNAEPLLPRKKNSDHNNYVEHSTGATSSYTKQHTSSTSRTTERMVRSSTTSTNKPELHWPKEFVLAFLKDIDEHENRISKVHDELYKYADTYMPELVKNCFLHNDISHLVSCTNNVTYEGILTDYVEILAEHAIYYLSYKFNFELWAQEHYVETLRIVQHDKTICTKLRSESFKAFAKKVDGAVFVSPENCFDHEKRLFARTQEYITAFGTLPEACSKT